MPRARAVLISGAGGTDVLSLGEVDVREPGPGEVLVEVAAAGLNRADILQRRGFYPAPPSAPQHIPGLEYAGVVAAVGPEVTAAVGDRVMGIVGGGAMATHLVVHHRTLIPVPPRMALEQAAAVPEVFLTAYDALFVQAHIGLGSRVLVHAAASGVGTAAMQLAEKAGAQALGTTRSESKLDALVALDAGETLVTRDGAFAGEVLQCTDGVGVDVILDTVGAAYMAENLRALADRGHIVVIGLLGGIRADVSLATLLAKRGRITGSVLRSRPVEEKIALARRFIRAVLPWLAGESVFPVVCDVMPMTEIAAAHARMEQNDTFGKIVLRW